jgi:hypothetical protein
MNTKLSKPRPVRGALYALLSLTAPLAALAAGVAEPANLHDGHVPVNAVLLEKVRAATERYKEVFNATGDGFVVGTPCVSGPDFGAMGVHYVRMDRVKSGVLAANQPQALIYEPLAGGGQHLVGVEYIILADPWGWTGICSTWSPRRTASACRRSTSCTCGHGSTIRTATSPTGIRTSFAITSPAAE